MKYSHKRINHEYICINTEYSSLIAGRQGVARREKFLIPQISLYDK